MNETKLTIHWPAVIQLKSDDELIYVANQEEFLFDTSIQNLLLQNEDRLIDCSGKVYLLGKSKRLEIISTKSTLTLIEVQSMLQHHLSSLGTCCVAKFDANSIQEAFEFAFSG